MTDNKDALYAAFKAKDARFDGRFFVGISSTGIYCRPVCRAKNRSWKTALLCHSGGSGASGIPPMPIMQAGACSWHFNHRRYR